MNYEQFVFFLDFTYVNLGLVPQSHYMNKDANSLDECFKLFDEEQATKMKRKFRKFLRKTKLKGCKEASFYKRQEAVKWYVFAKCNHIQSVSGDNDK